MPKSQERQIGGAVWTVTTIPTTPSLEILAALSKVALPALGRGLSSVKSDGGFLDAEVLPAIGEALVELGRGSADPEFRAAIKRLIARPKDGSLGSVHRDSVLVTPESYEDVFAGELDVLAGVAAFAIEVCFKLPLASWLASASGVLAKRTAPTSPPPSSSERKQDGI